MAKGLSTTESQEAFGRRVIEVGVGGTGGYSGIVDWLVRTISAYY